MPRPLTPTLTPYTEQLPDVNNPATWAERTPLFWNWVTGDGYENMTGLLEYADDVAIYMDTALAGSETIIGSVANLRTAQGSIRATYGGTANAITLTTALSLSALTAGMEFRFRAAATNTAAVTINVDGIGAVAVKDIYGQALPSDHILTTLDTRVIYDGTNFVDVRQVRSISAAIPTISGTAFTVTGIDPKATEISVLFNSVSLDANANSILVRLGTASGVIVSGYASSCYSNAVENSTTGFIWQHNTASGNASKGIMTIKKATAGVWMASLAGAISPTNASYGGGVLTGAGDPITTVSIARTGAASFNFGSFHVETRR